MYELRIKEQQAEIERLKAIAEIQKLQSETQAQNIENAAVSSGLDRVIKQLGDINGQAQRS